MKPYLFIMVGLSGSGKSTIVKNLASEVNGAIVSQDEIRKDIRKDIADFSESKEVTDIFYGRIRRFLSMGVHVFVDATNLRMRSRRAIMDCAKGIDAEIICYVIPKRIEDCIRDNFLRENPVPPKIIIDQAEKFEIPFMEEGFDEIIFHDQGYEDNKSFHEIFSYMIDRDQKNSYHSMTLDKHCENTYNLFSQYDYNEAFVRGTLIHDIGKVFTKHFFDGEAHYYNHQSMGAYYILTNLYVPFKKHSCRVKYLLDICFLINYHMYPFSWEEDLTHEKYKRIFGEEKYEMLMRFHECDTMRGDVNCF